MIDLHEEYIRTFFYYFIEYQENIPEDEKRKVLDEINEYPIHELISFLTFGDVLIENEEFIDKMFIESDIGQFILTEADTTVSKASPSLGAAAGYATGQTIKRVVKVGSKFVTVPVKYLKKGVWWIGGKVKKKVASSTIPGKDPKGGFATGLWHSVRGIPEEKIKTTDASSNIKRARRIASLKKFGKMASWVAIPAAAAAAGYAIYKKYFTAAKRKCANAPDKAECVKNYKTKALELQIKKLIEQRGKCTSSKEPQKCANKIDELIAKKREKISKL